jgi:hypothetical protein
MRAATSSPVNLSSTPGVRPRRCRSGAAQTAEGGLKFRSNGELAQTSRIRYSGHRNDGDHQRPCLYLYAEHRVEPRACWVSLALLQLNAHTDGPDVLWLQRTLLANQTPLVPRVMHPTEDELFSAHDRLHRSPTPAIPAPGRPLSAGTAYPKRAQSRRYRPLTTPDPRRYRPMRAGSASAGAVAASRCEHGYPQPLPLCSVFGRRGANR